MGNKQEPQKQELLKPQPNTQTTTKELVFTEQEQQQIKQVFERQNADGQSWAKWFNLKQEAANRFQEWITGITGHQTMNSTQWLVVGCNQYNMVAQILIKDQQMKKIDQVFQIMLYPVVFNEDTMISTEEATSIFEVIYGICHPEGRDVAILHMNRIYDDTQRDEHRVQYLISKMTTQMPALTTILKQALQNLVMIGKAQIKLPSLSHQSDILNASSLLLLCASDYKMTKDLTLLYSNHQSGSSFNRLAWSILGYGGPTLLVAKLGHKSSQWPIVYGAYTPSSWTDGFKFQGDSGCYLFSMSPCFRQFTTYGSKGGQNYTYLNTKFIDKSQYKVGLGFGGTDDFSQFRLWLDDDLENQSRVCSDDNTFQTGYVAGEIDGKVDIDTIEIWGMGGPAGLEKQEQYRRERQEELERMRKVDKKAFFNAFDQEFLLAGTFSHRAQVREDVVDQCALNKDRQPCDNI